MKERFVRPGDVLGDDEEIVLRGGRRAEEIVRADAQLDDLDAGTEALLSCRHQVWINPYHED